MTQDRSASPLDVLLIEDSNDDAVLLKRQLESSGYRVTLERVDTRETLTDALRRKSWDIVFSDFSMPRFDGMQALKTVREHDSDVPFIIVSGTIGEERAVQLMKLGAQDYVIKGNVRRLVPAVERELREAKLRREHRLAQEHIRHLAYYDPLTSLPNRHRLAEDLKLQLDAGTPTALLIVKLVNFGEINSTLGYGRGDQLIVEAASRLQQAIAPNGCLYHLHGSEFAITLQTSDKAQAEKVANAALKAFGLHFLSSGLRIHVGARIGIASTGRTDLEAPALLQQADLASKLAKQEGQNYTWYETERDPSSPERLALLADLREAVRTDQLYLVFQPKVGCDTGRIVGCEALLRWRHPQHGLIPPDVFIGMAERSGFIDDVTQHVMTCAIQQIRQWRKRGLVFPVAINLSARNLLNPTLMSEILSAQPMETDGEPQIEIEITETALMRNPEKAMSGLQSLHRAGTRIYVDDFGTGFSSLGYLKKLPIHAIKIDKSFVLDLNHNAESDTIVRSTIGLAHNLGLKVVAEGVENHASWQRLVTYGCDEAQGYYFAEPLSADAFIDMVANQTGLPRWNA